MCGGAGQGLWWQKAPTHTGKVGQRPGITRRPFSAATPALGPRALLQVPGSRENARRLTGGS